MADADSDDEDAELPHYIPMEKISAHPHEKELLFVGAGNKLKITAIYLVQENARNGHRDEIAFLNNIQSMI